MPGVPEPSADLGSRRRRHPNAAPRPGLGLASRAQFAGRAAAAEARAAVPGERGQPSLHSTGDVGRIAPVPAAHPLPHLVTSRAGDHLAGVTRDHALLVRRNDPGGNGGAIGADAGLAALIALLVDLQAKPPASGSDLGAGPRVVLADAGGENDAVDPAQRRRQRADLADDAVDEQGDRLAEPQRPKTVAAPACPTRCPTRRATPDWR